MTDCRLRIADFRNPKSFLAIVDYGMGNLRSVQKAFERVGVAAVITADSAIIGAAPAVVLPGVGAFGDAMANLRAAGLIPAIHRAIDDGRPFLGICLGQQLLFESSEEMGWHAGLGVFRGRVVRFPSGTVRRPATTGRRPATTGRPATTVRKVPHIGWNQVHIQRTSPILDGVADGSFAYFVHSFYVAPDDPAVVLATTDYGVDFASIIGRDRVFGIQFHPEKSQEIGLRILHNFASLVEGTKGDKGGI
jgi:glutamine amidotransferase